MGRLTLGDVTLLLLGDRLVGELGAVAGREVVGQVFRLTRVRAHGLAVVETRHAQLPAGRIM